MRILAVISLFFSLVFSSVSYAQGVPVQTWTPPIQLPAYLQGLRADRLGCVCLGHSSDTILLEGGSFASANGLQVFSFTPTLYTDPNVVGACGRDQSSIWSDGQGIYLFLITNGTQVCGLLSASTDYGGVIVPSGWTMQRKHPFAMNWKKWDGVNSGFADFHYAGTQNPWIEFRILAQQQSNKFIKTESTAGGVVCRNDWLPSTIPAGAVRMIKVMYGLYAISGNASAYIGPTGGALNYLGTITGNAVEATGTLDMVVQSDGTYCFRTNGGYLDAWVVGEQVTEVTD